VPTDDFMSDDLTLLISDARKLPAAMLPRPRTAPPPPHLIDLTALEIRIPDSAASLVDAFDDYGS
jgi:hypothetical protein